MLLVAGWYYARNWIVLGRPVYGGYEPERGFAWWQDPGYRTLGAAASTSASRSAYPINSSVVGFLDGFYSTFSLDAHLSSMVAFADRPPWNYDFLLAGAWWGLVPVSLMGDRIPLRDSRPRAPALRRVLLLSGACLAAMVAAMLYGSLRVPYYCVIKATYTLGLLPCYAVLLAAGFGVLTRARIARAAVYGLLSCWGLAAYLAYFVI